MTGPWLLRREGPQSRLLSELLQCVGLQLTLGHPGTWLPRSSPSQSEPLLSNVEGEREGGRHMGNRLTASTRWAEAVAARWPVAQRLRPGKSTSLDLDLALKCFNVCIVRSHLCFTYRVMSFHSAAQELLPREASHFRGQSMSPPEQ